MKWDDLASPLLPEVLGVMGIDEFILLSLLTCLFDFPVSIQYAYHISALVGFGQLWVNYAFALSEETRFFVCLGYLIIGLANVVFMNWYVAARDRRILGTTSFLCSITIPSVLIGIVATSLYVNKVPISLPWLPLIPFEAIGSILVVCAIVIAISLILSMSSTKHADFYSVNKRKGGDKRNENKQ